MRTRRTVSSRFHLIVVGLLAIAAFAFGACGARVENETMYVAASASPEMNCPQGNLSIRPIGNHQFQVMGCGLAATYQCQRGGGGMYGYRRAGYASSGCYLVSQIVRGGY